MTQDDPASEGPIEDYWSLPKSGPRVTVLNSAWTWTGFVYLVILLVVFLTSVQQNLQLFRGGWTGILILVAMLYPAWRAGSILSGFMKKRGIGANFGSLSSSEKSQATDGSRSVKDRLAKRRARLEKAREEGKL